MPVTDLTADLPAGRVFYRDSGGSAQPVVFLHAASGNSALWEYQVPALIDAGFRFIALDHRATARGSNSSALLDDLLTKLDIAQCHVLGTAAGGGAALQFALAHPTKVTSLVIANSIGFVLDREYLDMSNRIRPQPKFNDLPLDFRELGPSYRAANAEGAARWLELSRQGQRSTGARTENGGNVEVTWAAIETLKMPTLLLTGDADLYTPPSVLRMFAQRMPHATVSIVPETGHSSYWENPVAFNSAILAFLRNQ
ncbi:MAG: Twin-arginine translocation pathway signal [Betaproteobacteria bacterium]|nr:Twin-arginine translocation pathway signal [Betaproteobacteria bacterium]